mgnify:CR=1 FL=1
MKDNKCVNAYMNLSVHPSGRVKACCMSDKWYTSDNGETHLSNASIKDFWFSNDRINFAKQLESGEQVPECNACWQEEAAGKDSKRIRDNKTYAAQKFTSTDLPIVLDLSMGNLCNIKCRICSPVHSTPWLREEAELRSPNDIKGYMKQDKYQLAIDSFAKDNDYVWEDIKDLLEHATHFDFAGGEPFYIDAHWKIVDHCVEKGYSKNQYIHYNTNGTIFPSKYIDKLDTFKTVDIQISSDGVGKKFDYLRHGSPFEKCEQTIDNFLNVKENSNTLWYIGACLSVSAFNVFDFFETYEHYAAKGLRMYVNTVHDHHGVRILPTELKKKLIEKIDATESIYDKIDWDRQKNMICNLLDNTEYHKSDWANFWSEIKMRDAFRKENFEEVFPEYYQLAKDYINV